MSAPRFRTKIIGGKLKKVPIIEEDSRPSSKLNATYPTSKYDGIFPLPKINSRYSVLPPISDCSGDQLTHRVCESLANVTKRQLENVKRTFKRLDGDSSGRITMEELRQVFLLYQIFILGPTMDALVKKFEAKDGGVLYEPLTRFLLDCRQKISGSGVSPLSPNFSLAEKVDSAHLLVEVEHQLAEEGKEIDLIEVETSFSNCDRGKTGLIGHREMRLLCHYHNVLVCNNSLLEKVLSHFESDRDGWVSWREFLKFLKKALHTAQPKSQKPQRNIQTEDRSSIRKEAASVMISSQTQTSSGRNPIQVSVKGHRINLYPPDDKMFVPTLPPDEQLHLEWIYGYRGKDCRNNLYALKSGEVVYFMAAVAVVYDANSHRQRHYTEHGGPIKSLAVHPDGVTIATGQTKSKSATEEPHIRVWDSASLQTKRVVGLGHFQKSVASIFFSVKVGVEQGNYLVSVDDDDNHTITVWEWNKTKKLTSARGNMDQVLSVRFSPFENNLLVSCGKRHVSFWAIDDNNKLLCTRARFNNFSKPDYVTCLAFMMNGDVITGDSNGTIYLWPEGSNQISVEVRNAHDGPVYALLVLSNGIVLSAGGSDATVRAWNRTLQPTNVQLKLPKVIVGIRSLAVNGAELYMGTVQNEVWTTNLAPGTSPLTEASRNLRTVIKGHTQMQEGLAAQPGRTRFVSGGLDGTVTLWDAGSHKDVWSVKLAGSVEAAAFNPDGTQLVVGFKDGSFSLLDVSSGETRLHKKFAAEKISHIRFSSDGSYLALGSHDRQIYILQLLSDSQGVRLLTKLQGHASSVRHLDWSRDDTRLQSTSTECELLFWDVNQGEQVTSAESMRNTTWATHNCLLGYPVKGLCRQDGPDVTSIDRSSAGSLLAVGDELGNVLLYRYPCVDKKAERQISTGHNSPVTCVRFLHDDSRLISVGGRGGSLLQWKLVKSA